MKGYYTDLAEKLSKTNRIEDSGFEYTSFITVAMKELATYLDGNNLELTKESIASWLKSWISQPTDSKLRTMHGLISRVIRSVNQNLKMDHLFSETDLPVYNSIPDWGRRLLDEYFLSILQRQNYWPEKRMWAPDFLRFAIENGFDGIHIVDSRMTSGYYCLRSKCLLGVSEFIEFLASLGLASYYAEKAYYSPLAERTAVYCSISLSDEDDKEFPLKEYIGAAESLKKANAERGYSDSALKRDAQTTTDFGIFLEITGRGFSVTLVNEFLEIQNKMNIDTGSKKHVLMSVNDILHGVDLAALPPAYVEHRAFPVWCLSGIEEYESIRRKNHIKESTLKTERASFLRFFSYFDALGIKSFSEIERQHIKDFNIRDIHGTVAGKARFNLRMKAFLKFLYEEGHTTLDLSLSLSSVPAVRVRPPVILSEEEVDAVNEYAENTATLRDKAILKIGMQTGLRAVDIANLTFEAVDWEERVFNILQVKTGVEIQVPFSNGVGNALYDYITKERPNTKSSLIFINARAPFRPCKPTVVACVLGKVFGMESRGAHIMRKTFASKLTASEPFSIVAEALGHSNAESLAPYLSIDAKRLKECALSLGNDYAYKGGRL